MLEFMSELCSSAGHEHGCVLGFIGGCRGLVHYSLPRLFINYMQSVEESCQNAKERSACLLKFYDSVQSKT